MLLTQKNTASNSGRVASLLKEQRKPKKIARRRGLGKLTYLRKPTTVGLAVNQCLGRPTQASTISLIVVFRRYGVVPLTRTANGRLVE
jgi:hypothetical protein